MSLAQNNGGWHLDKKFSIGLLVMVAVQLMSGIWGGAMLYSEFRTDHETCKFS